MNQAESRTPKDTERTYLIDVLVGKGFYFINEYRDPFYNQESFYKNYGDHWGFRVLIYKNIGEQHTFAIEFMPNGNARFVFNSKDETLSLLFQSAHQHERSEDWRIICEMEGAEKSNLQALENKIEEIETIVSISFNTSETTP